LLFKTVFEFYCVLTCFLIRMSTSFNYIDTKWWDNNYTNLLCCWFNAGLLLYWWIQYQRYGDNCMSINIVYMVTRQ